jgi:hypothetical protein
LTALNVFEEPRMKTQLPTLTSAKAVSAAILFCIAAGSATAHHSFAMYDVGKTYVMTGVVTRVDPNPNHLQIFFAPLNEARDQVLKDDKGEPIVWGVEMMGAAIGCIRCATGFPREAAARTGSSSARQTRRRRPASTATRCRARCRMARACYPSRRIPRRPPLRDSRAAESTRS